MGRMNGDEFFAAFEAHTLDEFRQPVQKARVELLVSLASGHEPEVSDSFVHAVPGSSSVAAWRLRP